MGINGLQASVRELFDLMGLTPAEWHAYVLICRYQNRVSPRLLELKAKLREKGAAFRAEWLHDLVYRENPLLALIDRNDPFVGKEMAVPVVYKKS